MATYLILNIVVIALVIVLFHVKVKKPSKHWVIMFGALVLLTLIFDNLMIALDFFSYAPSKILGVHIWLAPVEDFMYALLAAILIPTIWNALTPPVTAKQNRKHNDHYA